MTLPGTETEADARLERAPRDIAALLDKAGFRLAAGDERGGVAYLRAALREATRSGELPLALHPRLHAAEAELARLSRDFSGYLDRALATAGFPAGARPPRFQESIEILEGRREARSQVRRPTDYLFPGLPERRYHERGEFDWAPALEAKTGAIRAELDAWFADGSGRFTPYSVGDPDRPRHEYHGMVDVPDWSTLYLWRDGKEVAEHASRFPIAFESVMALDLPHITRRSPAVMLSRLGPGARIPLHSGVTNARLICHLPLVVPPGCGFRVGGETREWREGELLVFDDSVPHEAWNDSGQDRIVLIFDVWHPGLSADERRAVTALFEAVDAFAG